MAQIKVNIATGATGTLATANIADDAITAAKIADNAVVTAAINADAVTDAKIADDVIGTEHLTAGEVDATALGADSVTAAKIGDNVLNSEHYAAASIDNEHLADNAADTAEIADNAITLAKMAGLARGKLIIGDSSGDPAALAVGSANQVLTADGTDFAWATAGGGGKILQVKVASNSSGYSGTSSSWTDATNFAVTITPASSSNHILIGINPGKISFSSYYGFFSAKRAISGGASTDNFVGDSYGFYWGEGPHPSGYFPTLGFAVDAPSTTSAITYTAQFRNSNNSSTVSFGSTSSQNCIFAIEVDGSTA